MDTIGQQKKDVHLDDDFVQDDKIPPEVRDYSHDSVIDTIDVINRELRDIQDQCLKIGVNSHLLEVEIASQFSPVQILELQKIKQSCKECVDTLQKQYDQFSVELESHQMKDTTKEVSKTDPLPMEVVDPNGNCDADDRNGATETQEENQPQNGNKTRESHVVDMNGRCGADENDGPPERREGNQPQNENKTRESKVVDMNRSCGADSNGAQERQEESQPQNENMTKNSEIIDTNGSYDVDNNGDQERREK